MLEDACEELEKSQIKPICKKNSKKFEKIKKQLDTS
jgi:hypothetical protein